MSIDRSMPWLVFPPAVDLANTVVSTPRGLLDLLTTDRELDIWIEAERGRIEDVDAARGRLGEVRELRDAAHALLHARASGTHPSAGAVEAINGASLAAPIAPLVGRAAQVMERSLVADGWLRFRGVIARSAIALLGESGDGLAACGAPSCGMLFVAENGRQKWCSPSCGNRARVARHAARRRATAS